MRLSCFEVKLVAKDHRLQAVAKTGNLSKSGAGADTAAEPELAVAPAARSEQARSILTRAALIGAARDLFGAQGYHATGTPDIVARSAVTRGALYHHFGSKEGLFEAVYRLVAQELSDRSITATVQLSGQTWPRVLAVIRANLSFLAGHRDFQRILLIDGPAVFGWTRWRDLQNECRLGGWIMTIDMLVEQRIIQDLPRQPLAHLIMALMDDAAMSLAHAADAEAVLRDVTSSLEALLRGLLISP